MTDTSFHDRIARLTAAGPAQDAPPPRPGGPGSRRPGLPLRFLIGLIFVPLGFCANVLTRLFLDDDITPEAVHYMSLATGVVGFHLVLFAGVALAVSARGKRAILNRVVLQTLIGYGIAGALLALALD